MEPGLLAGPVPTEIVSTSAVMTTGKSVHPCSELSYPLCVSVGTWQARSLPEVKWPLGRLDLS